MVGKSVLNNKDKATGQKEVRPVCNNVQRVNHQNFFNNLTHPHPRRNFVPSAVITNSCKVQFNTAKQSSSRVAASISTARPFNIVAFKPNVNDAKPNSNVFHTSHSPVRRHINQKSAGKTNNVNKIVNSAMVNNTARTKAVVSAAEGNRENAIKSSACWVWRPTGNVINHISKDSGSYMLKRFNYVDLQGRLKSDQGIFDSGCSRHITGNKSFLTDYQEIDGGFVTFRGSSKGGKITRKGKTRTMKLDFKDVYFVKELKFNLFSVSQMCDKKNSVLFTETECLVLSPNFKLLNESQVLLKVPRKNNMYGFDLKNIVPSGGSDPEWLFDIDSLTKSMNYELVTTGNQTNGNAGIETNVNAGQAGQEKASNHKYILLNINTASPIPDYPSMPSLEENGIFDDAYDDREVGAEADITNLKLLTVASPIPTTRVHKDHPKEQIIGDLKLSTQTRRMINFSEEHAMTLVDLPNGKRAIGTKWVFRNKKDESEIVVINKARLMAQGYTQEEGINYDEVFAPIAKMEAIRLFFAYASFIGFIMYQMDVKRAFLYSTIEEEVKLKDDGIFISQDKYVADILKKFDFSTVKTASTLMEPNKALIKDVEAEEVDVHVYRSMIRSLMYLTISTPDIMFAVCAYARFQVTQKTSHLHAVKRIFRYLKVQPKLGLWYPRDSPFDLESFSDSDCAGASLDMKSTTRGYQFLGKRKALNEDTGVPHTSVSIPDVPDEAVYKEWDDRVERATTTAASLDATHDSDSLEADLKHTKQVYGAAYTKLILKVKKLEKISKTSRARRTTKIVVSNDDEELEDPSKHGRKSKKSQPEDQLGVFSAAKILADTAKVYTYTRRRRAVNTGSGGVSTASRIISTAEEPVSTVGASMPVRTVGIINKDKGIMEESVPELFKATMRSMQDFVPMESEGEKEVPKLAEAEGSKRDAEKELDQRSSKKQKTSKASRSTQEQPDKEEKDLSPEDLQQM
uniref:Uncharacterized protein n=1 Tax=Tanacetum cinerariifolium TaxID=118510 RepID=A0A6L2NLG3_TANCI|nr:hypothetical protein [Tanacetum cinerariifolium]